MYEQGYKEIWTCTNDLELITIIAYANIFTSSFVIDCAKYISTSKQCENLFFGLVGVLYKCHIDHAMVA